MCGICGVLNTALGAIAHRDRIGAMSARLVHRGPDASGKFERGPVALAVRRLSIIDLESGDQPYANEGGEVTVVFNGEIYNYRALRDELAQHGHRFKTQADGEVIPHLYEERGVDFMRELDGMFAIALWDERRRRLMLARDRAGEKPLYYWHSGDVLAFASEIKGLLEYPGVGRRLNRDAVARYLLCGYFASPESVFEGIRKLPAAHSMIVEGGRVVIRPYWRLRDYLAAPAASDKSLPRERHIVEELRDRLREAVLSRLVSDVPLGVFLSGGADSSTLVALMSKFAPGAVETFCVAFPQEGFNEQPYADQVARYFGTEHHVLQASEESLLDAFTNLANHLDEPLADPAALPTYLLSRFARTEVKAALSGEGSDEQFGGYPTYLGIRVAHNYLLLPGALRRALAKFGAHLPISSRAVPASMLLRRFLAHADQTPAKRHLMWFGMLSPAEIAELATPELVDARRLEEVLFAPLATLLEGMDSRDPAEQAMYLDFRTYLEDDLLVKTDRASMACSLELRAPYLDHRLIEFAAGIPASLKLRGLTMKYLLKKAIEPWLPRQIVYRRKRGFSVPVSEWMRTGLRPLVDETLNETKLRSQGLFNPRFARALLEEHWSGRADHRRALWTLLCFQTWHDRWA